MLSRFLCADRCMRCDRAQQRLPGCPNPKQVYCKTPKTSRNAAVLAVFLITALDEGAARLVILSRVDRFNQDRVRADSGFMDFSYRASGFRLGPVTTGSLIIRMGLGGILCLNYHK